MLYLSHLRYFFSKDKNSQNINFTNSYYFLKRLYKNSSLSIFHNVDNNDCDIVFQ